MRKFALLLMLALLLMVATSVSAQDAVELRITWYDDGNEGAVLRDLLDRFEEENPGITVVVDTVAYQVILEQLPLQIEAGEGPDIARLTLFPDLAGNYLDLRPYLEDPAYWEANFPAAFLQAARTGEEDTGIYGFPTQFTVSAPYINRTLFEQAGVEVPSDTNDAVTWDEWVTAATEVAAATETPYAVAIDRSGHRFAGPAMSEGAVYFDADGNFTVDTEGFRTMAQRLIDWHANEITPAEVWIGSGGSYAAARDYFVNGELVLYMSGSWQVGAFANDIGDAFDWEVVPNPTGPGGSTGMPGGAALMAIGTTEHPEEVAAVMDFLASEEAQAEFAARTLFIPGHLGLLEAGIEYETDVEAVSAALEVFLSEIPKLQEQAYTLQYSPFGTLINNAIRDRLTQVLVGELTLDEAIERIQQDVDDGVAAAQQ
ncbi:MAG: extracellular solute-binding protein [bacterium]|nr:extracellular solute-binding protein [bacterium]